MLTSYNKLTVNLIMLMRSEFWPPSDNWYNPIYGHFVFLPLWPKKYQIIKSLLHGSNDNICLDIKLLNNPYALLSHLAIGFLWMGGNGMGKNVACEWSQDGAICLIFAIRQCGYPVWDENYVDSLYLEISIAKQKFAIHKCAKFANFKGWIKFRLN